MTVDSRRSQLLIVLVAALVVSTSFTGASWTSVGLMIAALTVAGARFGQMASRRPEFYLLLGGVGTFLLLLLVDLAPTGVWVTERVLGAILVALFATIAWNIVSTLLSTVRSVRSVRHRVSSVRRCQHSANQP